MATKTIDLSACDPNPTGTPTCFSLRCPKNLLEETAAFYTEIFHWKIDKYTIPGSKTETAYGFLFEGQRWGGGFVCTDAIDKAERKPKEEKDAGAVVYLSVECLEDALVKIEQMGGRRIGKVRTPGGVMAMSLFEDVAGNIMGARGPVGGQ